MITSFIDYFERRGLPTVSDLLAQVEGRPRYTFEDDMHYDHDTFLELDEFAEWITLNGVKLRAQMVWVSAERQKPDLAHKNDAYYVHPELHSPQPPGELLSVVFRAKDYLKEKERLPKNTETCYVNGDRFYVKTMQEEFGIAHLTCEADRQNTPLKSAARLPGLYE